VRRFLAILLCCFAALSLTGETIPPAPPNHFNDYANVISPDVVQRLNDQLNDFERQSSDQILVAIYPKMQSDSDIAEYGVRVARAWGVGGKQRNNGVVLLVFVQDRKTTLQAGYGLEGALPDAICKEITEYIIKPKVRQGDYNGGLTDGVNAIIAAVKGEFKGTGRTVQDKRNVVSGNIREALIIFIVIVFIVLRAVFGSGRRGWILGSGGWGGYSGGGWGGGSWGGGGGGGSSGTFSGGGGSFGGGGASSSW
jgi:uncharacterized protein